MRLTSTFSSSQAGSHVVRFEKKEGAYLNRLFLAALLAFAGFLLGTTLPFLLYGGMAVPEGKASESLIPCTVMDIPLPVYMGDVERCNDTVHRGLIFKTPHPVSDTADWDCEPHYWDEFPDEVLSWKGANSAPQDFPVALDALPVCLNANKVQGPIPLAFRKSMLERAGEVEMRVQVDEFGHYRRHIVLKDPHPYLTHWAETRVSRLHFSPGIYKGKPVRAWISVSVDFKTIGQAKWTVTGSHSMG